MLTCGLGSLDKSKLIDIVQHLFNAHPEIRQDIISCIPAPTVHSAAAVLNNLEKRLADSFPYNRHGPSRNDYTFSRVRGSLMELIVSSKYVDLSFQLLIIFFFGFLEYCDAICWPFHISSRFPDVLFLISRYCNPCCASSSQLGQRR